MLTSPHPPASSEPTAAMNRAHNGPATRLLSALVWVYRAFSANRAPACRFTPSCSEYALQALQRFGARPALPLIARRLARCRPGGPFGFDPVPDELPSRTSRRTVPSGQAQEANK